MMDFQLDQLRTLLAVVESGTLDAAAQQLHVTPSAVSQRLKALEQAVGRVLVQRTKPVLATESGEQVLRLARQMIMLSDEAGQLVVGTGEEDGRRPATLGVPIVVNGDSLNTWVLPALAAVPAELGITFELHREDEAHSTRLLRSGTVMGAVTSDAEPVGGCSVRRLGRMRYRPMASPEFADRWFAGVGRVEGFARAPVIIYDRADLLQDRYLRRVSRRRLAPPRHHIPISSEYAEAVALGLGWGMLPRQQSAADEAAGRLVLVDPPGHIDVTLYWQQWKLQTPALTTVADAIIAAAGAALD